MRLFVAIQLTEEMKDSLCDTMADLQAASRRGRFTHRENLHLTLVFIGETDRVDDILDVMEEVADSSRSKECIDETTTECLNTALKLRLTSPGVFRGRGGNLHWVGVENTPELKRLAKDLAAGLSSEGFPIEKKRFVPHITIAREVVIDQQALSSPAKDANNLKDSTDGICISSNNAKHITEPNIGIRPASMLADHISLMRSDRLGGQLVYTEIASVPL